MKKASCGRRLLVSITLQNNGLFLNAVRPLLPLKDRVMMALVLVDNQNKLHNVKFIHFKNGSVKPFLVFCV